MYFSPFAKKTKLNFDQYDSYFDFNVKYNIPFDFVLFYIYPTVTFNLNIPQRWSRAPVEEPGASSNHQFGYKWDVNWPGPVTTSDWSRTGVNKKYKYCWIQIQMQILFNTNVNHAGCN